LLVDNIRQLCKKNNISLWKLEQKLDIGNGVIARWDIVSPKVSSVKKVADYFNVTIDELLKNK
jgi:transcriptional regulator with XRE-family HTH domain